MLKTLIYLLLCSVVIPYSHAEPLPVKVGGYVFPPFVDINTQQPSGLTLDLITLLNQQQSEFHFTFIATSPKRRYNDFKRGMFDVIFFESMSWGWNDSDMDKSHVFLSGGEVFFTQNIEGRTQAFFNNLDNNHIVAMLGYHYDFLDKQHNKDVLTTGSQITFVSSPRALIYQVLNSKADIGIATYSYLKNEIKQNPKLNDKFLIKEDFDQIYQHRILTRKNQPLSIHKINALLTKIQKNGALEKLLSQYNLAPLK